MSTTTQAPLDALWGDLSVTGSTLPNSQPGDLGCWPPPYFSVESTTYTPAQPPPHRRDLNFDITASSESLSACGFDDSFDQSPILSSTIEFPSFLDIHSAGVPFGAFTVNISQPVKADEIHCPQPPANTLQNDCPIGRRPTRRIDISTSHSQQSLRERFADVMKHVRQFPEKPKNTLFIQFFTQIDDHYICLLCPASAPKALANRTQIIQHIAGGHGGSRPFACPFCSYRAIRKADLGKHTKEKHSPSKWYCSKCPKAYSNKRNMRRHEQRCKNPA